MNIRYLNAIPEADAFFRLYETTGWNGPDGDYSKDDLHRAISASWNLVAVYDEQDLIGFGRLISDGIYQTFITDVIVRPDYQNMGIGKAIVDLLLEKCRAEGIQWVQLSAAKGKQGFYEKFGFTARALDAPGMQMLIK